MSHYYRLVLKQVPRALEERLTDICFHFGAEGVSEKLDFVQDSLHYEPVFIEKDLIDLEVFFTAQPAPKFFEEVKAISSEISVEGTNEENRDWMEEWKKHFTAFPLVESFWVVPSWLQPPHQNVRAIWIDPGLAFGTGTHATTQLAANYVVSLFKEVRVSSVLDVGTGTGILAILAKHLGADLVEATEIDEMARQTAKENVEKNQSEVNILDLQVNDFEKTYDLVIANIIDGVLVQIKDDLLKMLGHGSHLVVSGILQERQTYFEENFLNTLSGYEIISSKQRDEWLSYLIKKL